MTPALVATLPLLRCPHCRVALTPTDGSVGCRSGHRFDPARQGYLNLLPGGSRAGTADSADMVAARGAFLAAGHYRPVSDALARAAGTGPLLDVGGGTGEHAAHVLSRTSPGAWGVTLDLSVPAARRAAGAHPRLAAVVADAWQPWPVADAAFGTVLSVFAPRAPAEALRVLAPGGVLVVATPTARHLTELVDELGLLTVDPRKPERLADQLSAFEPAAGWLVEGVLHLAADEVSAVVEMGPSAHHATRPVSPDPRSVTMSVRVQTYVRRTVR